MHRIFLASLVLFFSCTRATTPPVRAESPQLPSYQRTIIERGASAANALAAPVADAPAAVDLLYRVRPDRRFVNAAADVAEINGGRKVNSVEINFANDRWEVRSGGTTAITLPGLATFRDALSELTKVAAQQSAPRVALSTGTLKNVDENIGKFYPRFLFAALRQLDNSMPLDAASAARAARAASLLAVQTYDTFDLADPLRARALALLAIAKSLDADCCADTEALLAYVLGYQAEAKQLAASLPNGFVREYVTNADPGAKRDAAEQWLALVRDLRKSPILPMEDRQQFQGTIDIEAAPTLLQNRKFGDQWPLGALVQALVLRTMNGEDAKLSFNENPPETGDKSPAEMLRQYDDKLPAFAKARQSRLLGSRSVLSFYDANWYSALHQQYNRYFGHLGDVPGTTQFAASLKPGTAAGRAVAAWMSTRVAAQYGRTERFDTKKAMASVALLGGDTRHLLFDTIANAVGVTPPDVHRAASDLFATLDSRPRETLAAGKLADLPIGHLARRDQYVTSALDRAPDEFEGERAGFLYQIGDREGLRRLAADRKASTADRIGALCSMSIFEDSDVHTEYEEVFAESGYSVDQISCYWDYLNRRKRPDLKERFARKVLDKRRDLDAITTANIVSALGNALEAQGRYAEAWWAVEPHVPVYSANIISTATSILQRLDRNRESIELGRAMIERYPDADTRADFAAVLWRMRRNDEAAELFIAAKHAYSLQLAKTELPKRLEQTFRDSEIPQALAAYEALIKARVPESVLDSMSGGAWQQKRWALSFALIDRYLQVPVKSAEARNQQMRSGANGYEALRELKGPDAAMEWFFGKFPGNVSLDLLVNLYAERRLDLLTRITAARPPHTDLPEVAAILASSLTLEHVPRSDERWNVVRSLLTSAPVAESKKTVATSVRHLLGEVDEREVAQSVASATDRSEALYFLALRNAADGQYDKALGQFLAAGEGPANYATTSWAISQLYMWRAKQRTWSDIKKERLL